jgi:ferric-dicitrate binding protein FerR (iron transport regulator)
MIADRFWELLSKKVFAEANDSELKEFEELLLGHSYLKDTAEALTALGHQSYSAEQSKEGESAFQKHIKKIREENDDLDESPVLFISETQTENKRDAWKPNRKWIIPLASSLVILVLFFVFKNNITSSYTTNKSASPLSQVTTKPGSKTQIQLPDGSIVWLNASSNLTYGKDFGKDLREVNLVGEAFFDVVKDPAHPFIIHTKVIDVKVLGTEFNVKAYPNDAYTETSLIRGRVEVTVKNRPGEKHYLNPNEKVTVANNILNEQPQTTAKSPTIIATQPLTYSHADSTIIETSWVENKLIFQENETFKDVALKMERWYGVHISFADEEVAKIRPFGSFTNETISQALDALRETFQFNYKMNGNEITISK